MERRLGGTRVAGRGPGATVGATRVMPELWRLEGGTLRLLRGGQGQIGEAEGWEEV